MINKDTVSQNRKEAMETRNLAVGYGQRVVVNSIDEKILQGQLVSLLGPNGSGKTTILRTIAGLVAPVKGTVFINGRDLHRLDQNKLARFMAVVLTGHLAPGLLTAFEFVALGRYPYTGILGRLSHKDIKKTEECLHLVHAEKIAHRYFEELSDGERQKLVIARALAQEPQVIILDEPTSYLDLKHKIGVMTILRDLCRKRGITVVVSLHDVDLALKISDMVILIKDGKIMGCGSPDTILNSNTVKDLYDLDNAKFNSLLGTIDFIGNNNGKKVFVTAGGGTGVHLYRILSKKGMSVFTGVIHENDIDFHIARSTGAETVSEKPFEEIKKESLNRSFTLMEEADYIIDAGFPVGHSNRENLKLPLVAIKQGKDVYAIRKRQEAFELYGKSAKKLTLCHNTETLISKICKPDRHYKIHG